MLLCWGSQQAELVWGALGLITVEATTVEALRDEDPSVFAEIT